MGKGYKAIDILKKAVQKAPDTPELYYNLGEAYQLMENWGKAREAFKKVIQLAPESKLATEARKKFSRTYQPIQW
jgi:tetratricopeptide (TPR) repeat protein